MYTYNYLIDVHGFEHGYGGQKSSFNTIPQKPPTLFRQCVSLTCSSWIQICWLASKLQGDRYFCSPTWHHNQLFKSRLNLSSSHVCTTSTSLAEISPCQISLIVFSCLVNIYFSKLLKYILSFEIFYTAVRIEEATKYLGFQNHLAV